MLDDYRFDSDALLDNIDESVEQGNLEDIIVDFCEPEGFSDRTSLSANIGIPEIELVFVGQVQILHMANATCQQSSRDISSSARSPNKARTRNKCLHLAATMSAVAKKDDETFLPKHTLKELDWRYPLDKNSEEAGSVEKIMATISSNEGSPEAINWNDNGCGISVGAFQANQKQGQLPLLLARMQKRQPQLFENIFGREFANIVALQPQAIRHVQFTNEHGNGPNQLGWRLKEALKQPLFKETQFVMLREKILQSKLVASQYGIYSEKGVALVADMINQLGVGNDSYGARHYLKYALGKTNEMAKLEAIAQHDYSGSGRRRRDTGILANANLSLERPFRA